MKSNTRSSLIKALSYCSLRELPLEHNGEDVWIKALALVVKRDGGEYFVALEKDWKTLNNRVVKDFGPVGAICEYKCIYPYLYLDMMYMPSHLDRTKESRIKYLHSIDNSLSLSNLGLKELNNLIIGYAINNQLTQESNYQKIREYYSTYGNEGFEGEAGSYEGED